MAVEVYEETFMQFADIAVICAYFIALPVLAITLSRQKKSSGGFLSAAHDLPWWAICLSLVATETSTLTFISIPGVSYGSGMVFLGLAAGYFVGRLIVTIWFLPLYAQGRMTSAYQYLGHRFGPGLQRAASAAFLITRLLAEGVRLSAGLIPIMWMLDHEGISINRAWVMGIIMVFTMTYTMMGGLRAVVWSDTIQLCIYLFGAVICVLLLNSEISPDGWSNAWRSGHLAPFHHMTMDNLVSDPFTLLAALIGGAILSVASHGTDQLMVQRLLAARSLRDARFALMGSAIVIAFLFGILSLIGVQLWIRNGGTSVVSLGLHSPDDLFPTFIVSGLPAGLGGLLLAGVLSATMGSLSSTLNAMASAVLTDFGPLPARALQTCQTRLNLRQGKLFAPRVLTLVCSLALVLTALWFTGSRQSAVILGLTVAGWSYGPTLGTFLFGMLYPSARLKDALTGFSVSLAGMAVMMGALQYYSWHVAFPWLVPLGITLMLISGSISMMFTRGGLQHFPSAPDTSKD